MQELSHILRLQCFFLRNKNVLKTKTTAESQKTATKILNETGVNPDTRVKDMSEDDVAKLREYIDHNITVEGDLRRNVALNIKRLTEIGCYRGLRHRRGLPVRGQRTKTNARTRKGPVKTIANKKK